MADCEWERLRNWCLDNRLIDRDTGPTDMVSTILRLIKRMDDHIKDLGNQLDAKSLELKDVKKTLESYREEPLGWRQMPG